MSDGHYRWQSVHAEEAVLKLAGRDARGATLYVARIGRAGAVLPGEPCDRCAPKIARSGVRRVVSS